MQYKQAGVDIDAGNLAVERMKPAIRATYNAGVLADVGSFGGLYALNDLPGSPVLVASTDGVGTKVKLAAELGGWAGIGHDIVNHCVNDILVQNARPLFFLDYIASSKLVPEAVAAVVVGVAEACRAANCVLLGGETAEMPGVYSEGAFDLAGTVVGLVDRHAILPRLENMAAGDVLIGLPSSGPHTNGYSLIRRVVTGRDLQQRIDGATTLADALLAPHRCYLAEVDRLQAAGIALLGLAHITGGGFVENVPRVLPPHLLAEVDTESWTIPPLFQLLLEWSGMGRAEAYRVFNMGMGMVVIAPASEELAILELTPGAARIGRLCTAGRRRGNPFSVIGDERAPMPARLAVLISGSGSNLQAIIDAIRGRMLDAEIVVVVSNHKDAFGLQRAEKAGIPTVVHALKPYRDAGKTREQYDADLAEIVVGYAPEWVVLAGWMHILSDAFLAEFPYRVVNLHPALPGQFPGAHAIADALEAYQAGKIKQTGVMVHLVPDAQVDRGPVLATADVPIYANDTLDTLTARMHQVEHGVLVGALRRLIEGD